MHHVRRATQNVKPSLSTPVNNNIIIINSSTGSTKKLHHTQPSSTANESTRDNNQDVKLDWTRLD